MSRDARPSGPARLIALLWDADEPRARGRPPRLALGRVVDAAIELADRDGLSALTMRALAASLRASPMALYGHLGGRDDLLALMLDRACAAMSRRPPASPGWRAGVEAMTRDSRDLVLRHPWIAELPASRPALGPGFTAKYDRDLAALDGLGLDPLEMDRTLAALLDLAAGSARAAVAARRAAEATGLADEEWWALHAPWFDRVFDPAAFPVAARVGPAAAEAAGSAYQSDATFEAGLALMLDGLERRLARPAP